MVEIKITLDDVSNLSSELRSLNNNMSETLNNVRNMMNELSSYWKSDSGEIIVNKFNTFAKKFDEEQETIESYAKFLDYTVSTYDSLESTIKSNASSFN